MATTQVINLPWMCSEKYPHYFPSKPSHMNGAAVESTAGTRSKVDVSQGWQYEYFTQYFFLLQKQTVLARKKLFHSATRSCFHIEFTPCWYKMSYDPRADSYKLYRQEKCHPVLWVCEEFKSRLSFSQASDKPFAWHVPTPLFICINTVGGPATSISFTFHFRCSLCLDMLCSFVLNGLRQHWSGLQAIILPSGRVYFIDNITLVAWVFIPWYCESNLCLLFPSSLVLLKFCYRAS